VKASATLYVDLRAIGIAPFLVSVALRSFLAARGRTRPLVIAVVVGNIANLALDVILVFGVSAVGIPPLGVAGAAIATAGVQLLQLVIYFRALAAIDRQADAPPARTPSTRADLRAIVKYGLPVGGQLFAEVTIFGVATVLAARLGKVPAAAHAIALNVSSFTFAVAVGVGSATSVRVGHATGAGDLLAARRRGLAGIATGAVAMAVFGVVFVAFAAPIAHLFTDDQAAIATTVPLFQIAALFQMFDGIQAVGAGALRGLGDTRWALWANLIGHWVIGLPISLGVGFGLGYGVTGLWWGLAAGLCATAVVLVIRFVARAR